MLNKEKLFYDTLRDLFIGVEVEGQGGYIKLMKIKKKYYEKLEEELKESIEQALFKYPDFREELFDKLYSFFKRYFTESGAIYFNSTPFHNNVYEKVYTDEKDVVLFWKTHMLYYVKTDRVFRSMNVEVDGYKFFFDVSELQPKRNNEKRELIYELSEVKEDGTIHIKVKYSERGKETKTEEILKELKKNYKKLSEEVLEKAFRTFEKQSEVDYFINKNAREFLREQFKLWLYQYYFDNEGEFTKERVDQLNILKNIAYKIIDFISQFEDEVLKIWRKPKFVLNSNYVITLDRIVDKGEKGYVILEKILNHPNFEKQLQEWKELGIVDESFRKEEIIKRDLTGRYLNPKFKFLPVDTKYFKDLELDILSLFENLDNELDGWLIKSENWQALNTILPKFRGRIKTIYIDPPYNTGSDGFLYKDRYQHSTWLTMMENRLSLARELMSEDGVIFVSIDDNEVDNLLKLLKEKFSLVIPLHWRRNKTPQLASKTVATRMEFVLYGAMQEIKLIRERQSKVRPLFNFDGREYRIF
ncbi:MAG: DNA methyltransferase, partial [candidate division WOR-3 bacterium]